MSFDSLARSGVERLVIVNAHGGNYVLSNVVQEGNANGRRMALFPQNAEWQEARDEAGLATSNHDDMHAGEAETSILLHRFPDVVRDSYTSADHLANDRRYLLTTGLLPYAPDGVIGRPSLASPQKGRRPPPIVLPHLQAAPRRTPRRVIRHPPYASRPHRSGDRQTEICSPVGEDFLYVFKPAPTGRGPDYGRTAHSPAPSGLTASGLGCTYGPPATCRWTGL